MDRMLYLAMNGARQTQLAQAINTNNLANASTTGFKEDFAMARAMPMYGPGYPSRVYSMTENPGTDFTPGQIDRTGRSLDIAIKGQGFIAVQSPDGSEGYTRAGNLHVSTNGILVDGDGRAVLGNSGSPISIPPSQKVEIGADGTISTRPMGQAANALAQVDRIKLVKPALSDLVKGTDGLFHLKNGNQAPADASVQVVSGALEMSNVNPVDSMVNMIALARQYDTQVKMMSAAKDNSAAASSMMQL